MNTSTIAQKIWNYCNDLRDDGMPCGDYVNAAGAKVITNHDKPLQEYGCNCDPSPIFCVLGVR